MKSWISTPQVSEFLDALYADATENDPRVYQAVQAAGTGRENEGNFYTAMRLAYMPITREFGHLLYNLIRASRARTVVEFGTSFGVSTIFLASALRDNGEGKVITTEFEPSKAERARRNLATVGLEEWVEFRVGDARETLSPPPAEIDLALLDGPKQMYLDVLKLLEPSLRSGSLVTSDNTDHDGMEPFLDYLRAPANGYTSAAIFTGSERMSKGQEISVRN